MPTKRRRQHTQHRRKVSKNKTLRRPRVVGKGVTSCVVKPRYQCNNETGDTYQMASKGEIGKIMNRKDAKEETQYTDEIHKLDPSGLFTLGESRVCMPTGSASDIRKELLSQGCNTRRLMKDMNTPVAMVITQYGGKSVDDISPTRLANSFKMLTSSSSSTRGEQGNQILSIMVTEAMRLLYAVSRIQSIGRTHFDLHSGNVLIHPKTGELRVIDFVNANTNEFMVPNDDIVQMILHYASLMNMRNYLQFPTELPMLAILASNEIEESKKVILDPVIVLDPDLPMELREAIEDGAEGRSPAALRSVLRTLSPKSPFLVIGDILLPERIPEGDTLFHERCRAIVGMREMTRTLQMTPDRTRRAFRECIRTIDSFAAGNVLHEYLVKTIGGLSTSVRMDMKRLGVFLQVIDGLRNPNPSARVRTSIAIQSLISLASTLPKDPRDNSHLVRSRVVEPNTN